MFKLVVILSVLAVALADEERPLTGWEGRIVGGSNAAQGQFPYQCSLRGAANRHFCGCSIISNHWALSAAHCTIGRAPNSVAIQTGTHLLNSGGASHEVVQINNHPNYDADTIAFDVSTLRTLTTILFNAATSPINLASFDPQSHSAMLSGWGQTGALNPVLPNNLQFIQTQTLTNADCQALHTANNAQLIFPHKLCTFTQQGQGACMGDSGGPLTIDNEVHGIVSWGIPCARGRPDVFDRVFYHRGWIIANSS